MELLISWLIYALAILISAYLLPGVYVDNFWVALIVAIVLGILNALLKPFLLLLTLPINILTLGLFTLVINAFLILLTSSIVSGFKVNNFWWAFIFSIILSIISSFFSKVTQS